MTIIGPGSLGSALSQALHSEGIEVAEIVYRSATSAKTGRRLAKLTGAEAVGFGAAQFRGDVVWLCVGDSAIRSTGSEMARRGSWRGKVVFHSSGALTSNELDSLRRRGAKVASVHPMMTFVDGAKSSMEGVTFALEGDGPAVAVARNLVKVLGGETFKLNKVDKPLYHALGAFVSPMIVAQMATAERIGRKLGLKPEQTRKIVSPILQQTVRNYVEHSAAAAFSGPIIRGDAETVRKNLGALRRVRGAAEIYRSLAKVAVEELPSKDRAAVKKAIR